MMNFEGTGHKLAPADIESVAEFLECSTAALRAVIEVESAGSGFGPDNRPLILFEPHVFYRLLGSGPARDRAEGAGLAYKKWGTRPYPKSQKLRYTQLIDACLINEDAALKSVSWGLGQVMGYHHTLCGYPTVQAMVEDIRISEGKQLMVMAKFIKGTKLNRHLSSLDWSSFALGYNGSGYEKNNYHTKLADAYNSHLVQESLNALQPERLKFKESSMEWEDRHRQTLTAFSNKFGLPTSGPMVEPYALNLASQFKFSHTDAEWGAKSTVKGSPISDAIAFREGAKIYAYDCIKRAGAPDASLELNPAKLDISDQYFVEVTAKDHLSGAAAHSTALGASLFYALRAWRDRNSADADSRKFSQILKPNLDYIKNVLRADYIRVFWSIGALRNPNDIWILAGSSFTWPDIVDQARSFTEMVWSEFQLKTQWTVSGGPEGFDTDSELARNCARFVDSIRGLESKLFLIECMNEYVVNTGDETKGRHILRNMARALAPHVGGVRLSLSSPNEVMGGDPNSPSNGAEVSRMYPGLPPQVNAITPHWARNSSHYPEWHVPPNMGPDCPPHRYGNEGVGQGSSVIPEYHAGRIASHYDLAIKAHYAGWLWHTDAGIWSTRIPQHYKTPERGKWENLKDVPNSGETAQRLRELRETGSTDTGGSGGGTPTNPGSRPDALFAGQELKPGQSLIAPGKKASLQNQLDGNLVGYADVDDGQGNHPVWASHTEQTGAGNLRMQEDGNLVKYNDQNQPIWASNTGGHPGAMVQIQDDGNFVIYKDTTSGVPIWASRDNP